MTGNPWRIELFGGLRAHQGERTLTRFETRRIDALLAYLALGLRRSHRREVVAEQLWPEESFDATRNRLRQALSSLRHDLEPEGAPDESVLRADRNEVHLDFRVVSTDVAEFEAAVAGARDADAAEQTALLRQAISLYRGELLPGFYDEWILTERERLADTYRDALGQLARALGAAGELPEAVDLARQAVAADPIREDAHCELMRLYHAAGRTAEAVRQYRDLERLLRSELGTAPSAATQALAAELRSTGLPSGSPGLEAAAPRCQPPGISVVEPDGGAVPLHSPFYVERTTDHEFREAVARRDSIVLVKGPRQIGKTSLLARGLHQARAAGTHVVTTDLQKLAPEQLESAATLFYALAEMIVDQLDLDLVLEERWNPRRGWNVNFERLLRREVLGSLPAPLVWGLDEVDRLFSCSYSNVVFGLFRSWHNERALDPDGPWGNLTLAISYATEAHLFITDLNQSPFNVGTRLTLADFSRGDVEELNRRYGAPLDAREEVPRLFSLVGGHPYLVRRGLHAAAAEGLTIGALEEVAGSDDGPFGDHLRRMLIALTPDTELREALRAVLHGRPCPTADSFYRLRSAGVIAGADPQAAQPRCRLYRRYLEQHLL